MKLSTNEMTFQELSILLDEFDKERQWINLDPSDLAKSIMLEWAELLEHFQRDVTLTNKWKKIPEKNKEAIKYEVADILIYLMKFCREMNIDIVQSTIEKLDKIAKKYPSDYNKKWWHEEYLKIKKKT